MPEPSLMQTAMPPTLGAAWFLLPRGMGLLEWILVTQLMFLGVMGLYGVVLRKLVASPRDSVVVFHRIFWRKFLRPKSIANLDAYDGPVSMGQLDDDEVGMIDGLGAFGEPSFGDEAGSAGGTMSGTAGATSTGTTGGTMGGTMAGTAGGRAGGGSLHSADDSLIGGIPPEPEPVMSGEQVLSADLNVEVVPNSPQNGLTAIDGDTLTLAVTCAGDSGLANRTLMRALCHHLDIQTHQVTLLRGHMASRKVVRVSGMDLTAVQTRLLNR